MCAVRSAQRRRAVAMLIALAGFAAPCVAETYAAKVVGITDGDTVTVLDAFKVQHKIRLSGIDGKVTVVRPCLPPTLGSPGVWQDSDDRDRQDRPLRS